MNEGSGSVMQNSAFVNEPMTLVNSTSTSWVLLPYTGRGIDFATSGPTYISIGTPVFQASLVKDLTIMARVYLRDSTQHRIIYAQNGGATTHQSVKSLTVKDSTGKLRFYTSDNTGAEQFVETSTLSLSTNTWYDVAVVIARDASKATFFVNGVSEDVTMSFTQTATPDSTVSCRIGSSVSGLFSTWDGYMEYCYVWSAALSHLQVREVMAEPLNVIRPARRLQFPIDPLLSIVRSVDSWHFKPPILWRKKVKPKPYQLWGSFPVPEAPVFAENLECSVLDLNYGATVEADPYTYDTTVLDLGYGATVETS